MNVLMLGRKRITYPYRYFVLLTLLLYCFPPSSSPFYPLFLLSCISSPLTLCLHMHNKNQKKTRTPPSINPSHPNYERGEFKPVIDLLGEMPNGRLVKQHLDEAIDECDKLQNLRQAIIQCKRAAERGGDEERPAAFWNARGSNYLHRYIYLIIYTAYLLEETPNGLQVTFSEWVNQRWNYKRSLKKLVLQ
mmetsp:Transcript_8215/g.21814  ORF Transcript_8215/g.21814 Transcript_8215/m.21814 type:complete len:191 (-) Transcript_8215:421-993(-)